MKPTHIVHDLASVNQLLKDHELQHSLTFRNIKVDKGYGTDIDLSQNVFTIRYEDPQKDSELAPGILYDGIPFTIMGRRVLECHQGKDRKKKFKEKAAMKKNSKEDHDFRKSRRLIQPTKKKDCPAMIRIRHIVKFVDYKLEDQSAHKRSKMSARIHGAVDTGEQISVQSVYLVYIPPVSIHNHLSGEIASLVQPIDMELKKYIRKMVLENNITDAFQMKLVLDVYVTQVIFKGKEIPSKTKSRYWPNLRTIRNHILLSLKDIRNNSVDQKIVEEQIQDWQTSFPNDKFYLQLKEEEVSSTDNLSDESPSDIDDETTLFGTNNVEQYYGKSQKFMFVHQTSWQQRLLLRYGNEISLLDATYRTTKYALPLYFLCVPTNVNYICVASFIIETEDQTSIEEALKVLKDWNPEWKPRYFMCDYATEEISALENVFPVIDLNHSSTYAISTGSRVGEGG